MAKDWVSPEMVKKAMEVDLLSYAQSLGMEFESRGSNDTLYQKGHSLNITQSKNMYNRFSTGRGGNVINFAMEMNGWTFQQAVRALCGEDIQKNFHANISASKVSATPQPKEKMVLPKASQKASRAFAYLVKTRKIDPEIVSKMMHEHKIYENDKHSCVFVGYNERGQPGYASVRSTNTEGTVYRGEVKNSDKKYGFTIQGLPQSDTVYVFEAPIDALSHATLTKMCGGVWNEDWRVSLGGFSDLALEQFLKTHPWIKNIHFGTDNDLQGNSILENKYNQDGSIKKLGYLKKYKDMGYEVYREEPMGKDFNEELQMICQQKEAMEQGFFNEAAEVTM